MWLTSIVVNIALHDCEISASVFSLQYTEESLGHADKTDLDPGLEELFTRVDATKTWTDQIISQTEVLLQPNTGESLYRSSIQINTNVFVTLVDDNQWWESN